MREGYGIKGRFGRVWVWVW